MSRVLPLPKDYKVTATINHRNLQVRRGNNESLSYRDLQDGFKVEGLETGGPRSSRNHIKLKKEKKTIQFKFSRGEKKKIWHTDKMDVYY